MVKGLQPRWPLVTAPLYGGLQMWAAGCLLRRIAFFLPIVQTAVSVSFFLPRLSGQGPIREGMIKRVQSGCAMQFCRSSATT